MDPKSRTNTIRPIYVGRYASELDTNGQFQLNPNWCFEPGPSWIIYPHSLLGNEEADFRYLRLDPVTENTAAQILALLKTRSLERPVLDTAVDALRALARSRGLDPLVISKPQLVTQSGHLSLTAVQRDWLGIRSRSLMLTGTCSAIHLWPTEEFERYEQQIAAVPFDELMKRTCS